MRPRVLILAHANPLWTQYYVEAFRELADVVLVGPRICDETRRRYFDAAVPDSAVPDVAADFQSSLRNQIPNDFRPDLVVGISGVGGDPLPEEVSEFACPTAFITVDTWQCILDYPQARRFDYVFAAQREFLPRLEAIGARNVAWLPLACAPRHHCPISLTPNADIAFAGSLSSDIHRRRREYVERLSNRFNVFVKENAYGDLLCEVYARGKLGFNHCAVDEINMRVFEVMAMGRPLLVNRGPARNGLLDLFQDGRHLIIYDGPGDLESKVVRYLADDSARDRIAAEGPQLVLERHTYRHRAQSILQRTLSTQPAPDLWRQSAKLADLLPHGVGRLLDVGMQLESSKHALRKRGATDVVGVTVDGDGPGHRRASYDEIATWPPHGHFDTVVVSDPDVATETTLRYLRDVTLPGAALLARFPEALVGDRRALVSVLDASGFHIIDAPMPGAVRARCFTRTVRDVVLETFSSHPEAGYDPDEVASRVPDDL